MTAIHRFSAPLIISTIPTSIINCFNTPSGQKTQTRPQTSAIASCGYHPDRGADLWDEGLKRWCKHGEMDYLGMLCRRDFGPQEPFMNEERDEAARDFAHALYLTVSLSL